MAEHYLNVLTVRLRGYNGQPMPGNLAEEFALQVTVGARVDVEQLADDLKEDACAQLREGVRHLAEDVVFNLRRERA
jgi:hypothetical protein